MVAETKSLVSTRKFLVPIAILAALAFNNWALGPIFNRQLFAHSGSVSEFSAIDQPYYVIFRTLDIFSGLLFVLLALLLAQYMGRSDKWRRVLLWGLTILGLSNLFDAVFTLRCSETLDLGCKIPINVSFSHLQLPSHAYSSVVIAICYFLLPLAGVIYGRAKKFKFLIGFSVLAVLVALATFVSAIVEYLDDSSFSVRTSGIGQEVQMLIIGMWLVAWVFDIYHSSLRPGSKPVGS